MRNPRNPRHRGRSLLAASIGLAALLLGPTRAGTAAPDELVLAAAVSLREPVLAIVRRFEAEDPGARVRVALGASSTLAAQIEAGAPVDVFASADERLIGELIEAGRVDPDEVTILAGNRLVVLGAPDREPVDDARSLFGPDVRRVAIAARRVPVGRYAQDWLESSGLAPQLADRRVVVEHARAALTAVDLGYADLAVVYVTDARAARRARVVYVIPEDRQPEIRYAAALVRRDRSDSAQAHVRRLLQFLTGAEAAAILGEAGFAPPPARADEPTGDASGGERPPA